MGPVGGTNLLEHGVGDHFAAEVKFENAFNQDEKISEVVELKWQITVVEEVSRFANARKSKN